MFPRRLLLSRLPGTIGIIASVTWAILLRRALCGWIVFSVVGCTGAPVQLLPAVRLTDASSVGNFSLRSLAETVPSEGIEDATLPCFDARTGRSAGPADVLPERFLVRCRLDAVVEAPFLLGIELFDANLTAIRVGWSPSPESSPTEGWIDLSEPESLQGTLATYRAGPFERVQGSLPRYLWIEAIGRTARGARLRNVSAAKLQLSEKRLESVQRTVWTFDFENEWREGLIAFAGKPFRWKTDVPAQAELRFEFHPGALRKPRFWVRARTSGEERELFSSPSGDSWSNVRISLAEFEGEAIELEFGVSADSDDFSEWGSWSVPTIYARAPSTLPKLVLLISIDTLRADHLSLYGYRRPTSPRIDRWAERDAVVFERAQAQAAWTLPSHVSIFTGLEPLRHGVNLELQASRYRSFDNLASQLSMLGFQTAAVTGGGYVHPSFGFAHGFDRYAYWPADADPDLELEHGVDAVLKILDESRGAPQFVFFHTYEVHPPNRPRQPYFAKLSPDTRPLRILGRPGVPTIENGFVGSPALLVQTDDASAAAALDAETGHLPGDIYDSSIQYMDQEFGRLLDGLAARGLADDALVVLTSDHGESLGEAGRWSHGNLDPPNLHVPLILDLPGTARRARTVAAGVRSIDIAPTILDALGAEPRGKPDGQSLLDLLSDSRGAEAPGRAWAYGSSNNRGLALRLDNGEGLLFLDSAFPPIQGKTSKLDSTWTERTDLTPADVELLRKFRSHAGDLVQSKAPGLRLDFVNPFTTALSGFVRNELIEATTVKSADVPEGSWTWAGRGKSRVHVPPGARFSVILQDRGRRRESVNGDLKLPGCDREVEFEALFERSGSRSFGPGAQLCTLIEVDRPSDAIVRIAWRGGSQSTVDGETAGSEVRAQLQALGYL